MTNKGWKAESDKRGIQRRQGPWGVAGSSLAILLVASFSGVNGWARHPITKEPGEDLHLAVRVYSYIPISPHELASAERVSAKILQHVGVELSWVDCPLTRPRAELNPVCTAPLASTDIQMNLVRDFAAGPWVGEFAMGLAVAPPPPDRGQFASISFARAKKQFLEAPELTLGQLVGHGIAHEIGHLLLGTNSHSPSGLMCAHWNAQELKLAAYTQLRFSADQAVAIRDDVRARHAQQ